ncbi:MAG: ribbon-helix-helix domain-containing protein [Methanomassiliicoccus sp.]|nr:ribbon-helix-helix domain-containing protein [Methanomassiliicoccus sp.]
MTENSDEAATIAPFYKRRGTTIINVRVPQALVTNMDMWVENGEFKSRSEFVVTAIRQYLDYLPTRRTARDVKASFDEEERPSVPLKK